MRKIALLILTIIGIILISGCVQEDIAKKKVDELMDSVKAVTEAKKAGERDALAEAMEKVQKLEVEVPELGNKATDHIIPYLDSTNDLVRKMSGSLLADIGTAKATQALIEKIKETEDEGFRSSLISSFRQITNSDSANILLEELGKQTIIGDESMKVLTNIGDEKVVEALINKIRIAKDDQLLFDYASVLTVISYKTEDELIKNKIETVLKEIEGKVS